MGDATQNLIPPRYRPGGHRMEFAKMNLTKEFVCVHGVKGGANTTCEACIAELAAEHYEDDPIYLDDDEQN